LFRLRLLRVAADGAVSGSVRFPVKIERRLYERRGVHQEATQADSSVTEAVLVCAGLGEPTLEIGLTAGPYEVNLGSGALNRLSP
jgi:hypothetical protein